MINCHMSTEQILREATHTAENTQTNISSSKVDINILMEKVRTEKKKEKKENLIFMSFISSVILITIFIASF